ncbi:MAG: 3-hydroxyacyl-CoA dehydrogenase NAD-binding domain-containing protein [Chloroflexi bacterium]|nr:3-hydroxyacyl-CoA dehydrogenase NAD-binding domain-containing protein [Chloroflexota bacterium]
MSSREAGGVGMKEIQRVAVVGAGTMGRQIALQCARHGFPVALYDVMAEVLQEAEGWQRQTVAAWIETDDLAVADEAGVFDRIQHEAQLPNALAGVDLAIEAVPERIALKRDVFAQLDRLLPDNGIIATNSSSIRVSALEDATERPERVANMHFYLPVWDSPMVEIGGGSRTRADVLDSLTAFARAISILPLRVRKESTGFVFNRVWRAVKKEVMRVADSGVASIEDIDRAWMIKFGRSKPPPFAQMDRIGLDVIRDIELRYAAESGDAEDLPRSILTDRIERGDLGLKTGRGFYQYPDPAWARAEFLDADADAVDVEPS